MKKTKFIAAVLCLSLLSTSTVFASETVTESPDEAMSIEQEDPSALIGTDIGVMPRVLTGKTLFSMTINGLNPGSLVTTRGTVGGVKDSEITNFSFGVYNFMGQKATIGLCTFDAITGLYYPAGSVTTSSQIASFTAKFPYATAYGYVKNPNSSGTLSGKATILELN